jgi:hypothetical protein
VLDFLERIGRALPLGAEAGLRVFLTGSGAQPLTSVLSAPFVQEVNALTLAVERLYRTPMRWWSWAGRMPR